MTGALSPLSRRGLLRAAGAIPLVLVAGRLAAADTPAVCADPAKLPLARKSQRRALGYVEPSTDPKRRCGACAFFTAAGAGCGTCQLMSGGPVSAFGVCNSFAAKAG
jgi:hypothetical protein